jgi:hypothetical protein
MAAASQRWFTMTIYPSGEGLAQPQNDIPSGYFREHAFAQFSYRPHPPSFLQNGMLSATGRIPL